MYVHVVTPDQGWVRIEQRGFMLQLAHEKRFEVVVAHSRAKPIPMNRNKIVKQFLGTPQDHKFLFMLDADVVPRGNPMDYVEDNLDVVIFPCPLWTGGDSGEPPIIWNITSLNPPPRGERTIPITSRLLEIQRGGTGAILIARRVLEHPDMCPPFIDRMDDWGARNKGHDVDFCDRVRAAGFKVWAALRCPCSHYKDVDLFLVDELLKRAGG